MGVTEPWQPDLRSLLGSAPPLLTPHGPWPLSHFACPLPVRPLWEGGGGFQSALRGPRELRATAGPPRVFVDLQQVARAGFSQAQLFQAATVSRSEGQRPPSQGVGPPRCCSPH